MSVIEIMLVILVAFGVIAAGALLFALAWHLFYAVKGKPDLSSTGISYSGHLVYRGLPSFCVAAMCGLVFCSVGASLTARMDSARVWIDTDRAWWAGDYVRTYRDSLPESNRGYLDSDDVLFVAANRDKLGQFKIMKIVDKDLRQKIGGAKSFRLVEARWTLRYPAKLFRWMGPVIDRPEFTIQIGSERLESVIGISWRSSIKS